MCRSSLAKRLVDLLGSIVGIALFSLVFALVAIAIVIESRGGVFFRQKRVGLHGRAFRMVKFRSMVANAEAQGPSVTARGDIRITRVGAFIRRTKLDELPQFFNVLAGSMSLVGPRPEVPAYFELYAPEQQAIIVSVKPGMTDFAAIELKDEEVILAAHTDRRKAYVDILMPRKFALYKKYIDEQSFLLDLKIIWRTIVAMAKRR